jgi:hypothetical protein
VSECWSKRWVIQWALSDNSQETKIIFYCFKSEGIHNKCFLSNEEKLLFWKTLSVILRISLYETDSVYTWLNNDWTLKRNVTDVLSQQFFWLKMLQNVCTFCWNCNKCCMNNSWKDADKASWSLYLKQIWWKIFIDFVVDLLSSESCMNLLIITDCLSKKIILKLCKNMTAEWVTQTFIQHFYWAHELFITIVSNWGTQFVSSYERESVNFWRLYEECSQHITQNWQSNWANESECWAVHLYVLQL